MPGGCTTWEAQISSALSGRMWLKTPHRNCRPSPAPMIDRKSTIRSSPCQNPPQTVSHIQPPSATSPSFAHRAAPTTPCHPHLASPLMPSPSQDRLSSSASRSLSQLGARTNSYTQVAPPARPYQSHSSAPAKPRPSHLNAPRTASHDAPAAPLSACQAQSATRVIEFQLSITNCHTRTGRFEMKLHASVGSRLSASHARVPMNSMTFQLLTPNHLIASSTAELARSTQSMMWPPTDFAPSQTAEPMCLIPLHR